jgi:hypothetical protein
VLGEQGDTVQDRVIAARATVTYGCALRLNGAHGDLYWFMLIISLMCNVAIMNLLFTLKTYHVCCTDLSIKLCCAVLLSCLHSFLFLMSVHIF